MPYILGVKWLSDCSEVGDHEIYQKDVQVTPFYSVCFFFLIILLEAKKKYERVKRIIWVFILQQIKYVNSSPQIWACAVYCLFQRKSKHCESPDHLRLELTD